MDAAWTVACCYLVVLARAPDPGGLANYVDQLSEGISLRQIATDMTASDEFASKVGAGTPADTLCANALGRAPETRERALPLPELVVSLVTNPEVQEHLGVLERLVEGEWRLDDEALYPWWAYADRLRRSRRPKPVIPPGLPPLLSILIVMDRPQASLAASMLGSIVAQRDPRYQIVVAHRGPLAPEITALLARHRDAIAIVTLAGWRSASALRNKALRVCRGDFVASLGQHDRLADDTVSELSCVAQDSAVVFSDADVIAADGTFRDPTFHAAWDPDFALAGPPRGLVMVRTALVRALGGWRRAAEDEPDWDMLLRASRRAGTSAITHVPAVLLHRRAREPAPNRRRDGGSTVVTSHLRETGRARWSVENPGGSGPMRIRHPVPTGAAPLASILIPTRDRAPLLRQCVAGLLGRTAYPAIEVLIVDNDSREAETFALFDTLMQDSRVRVIKQGGPFNWSALNNHAVRAMRGEVAVLLNNDTDVIDPAWLSEMVAHAMRPDVGVVGAKLLYRDGTVQHAGIVLGPNGRGSHIWRHAAGDAPGHNNQLAAVRTMSAVTGACLAFRREVFDEVGGIEQETLKVTWSDVDLCLRVQRAGYRVVWTPHALLYHLELASRGSDDAPEAMLRYKREQAYMRRTWGAALDRDPFFSPSLKPNEGPPLLARRTVSARRA